MMVSMWKRYVAWRGNWRSWHWLIALFWMLWGFRFRLEHSRVFHPEGRQADYENTLLAIQKMAKCHCFLWAGDDYHNGYHGPLWYKLAAWLYATGKRGMGPVLWISLVAYLVRQLVIFWGMRSVAPRSPWAATLAVALSAVVPVSMYQDGVAYNESLHTTLFAISWFALWRMEQQGPRNLSLLTAGVFGLFAGLGLITKASSAILPIAALGLALWWLVVDPQKRVVLRAVTPPALTAMFAWLSVAGWWCAHNLVAYGSPIPHQYDVRREAVYRAYPDLIAPLAYKRPLGWFLPFDARVWYYPFQPWDRHTFWGETVGGTWADSLNHGYCRLPSSRAFVNVFSHSISDQCVVTGTWLVQLGVIITLIAVVGVALMLVRFFSSRGRQGSLVVPLTCALMVALLMMFGMRYVFDHHPVVKADYALNLLPGLCAGFGLVIAGETPPSSHATRIARAVAICAAFGALLEVGRILQAQVHGKF